MKFISRVAEATINIVKSLLATNPARFIAYGATAAIWAAAKLGAIVGVEVPDDVTLAAGTIVTFVLTEAIRRFVYAPATVEELVAEAQRPLTTTWTGR